MKVKCSKCETEFNSLIIDRDMAWKELLTLSSNHIKFKHPAMFAEMSQAVAVCMTHLTTFMHMSEFCTIDESETEILGRLETCQEVVMAAIGFDPEDDEDDEEELEFDEDEDTPDVGEIELPGDEEGLQAQVIKGEEK